ncbi:macro domain-containing protein [Kineosporia succinea]|uniref:O-acetyl-ADP-ribose deacetylase (Regulator of RNase III) n=1 Tax=Kineosporia succinea TaxID=84632 RepID=A0ABT9PA32_9ACTN|nr:hypothetical protein [Kineosporia succinea]MDP9829553.1 O-acetyl-ADP-ribose deacetylase (regulator of RNase III) [Kineosporia succinea]
MGDRQKAAAGLREFCRRLATLHREAGGPSVDSLSRNPQVPLKRSQIYAVLRGEVSEVPSWEFVSALVSACREFAGLKGRALSLSTSPGLWRSEYTRLEAEDARRRRQPSPDSPVVRATSIITGQRVYRYRLKDRADVPRSIAVVAGDIREVDFADVWVNSENTDLEMARVQEFSVSAIIRYGGAVRDGSGRVVRDVVADELGRYRQGSGPVAPATAVRTGPGELLASNNVRHIIHVAAVHGEPGAGFVPVMDIGRCVHAALRLLGSIQETDPDATSILFPILGAGTGGGTAHDLVPALTAAAGKHLTAGSGRLTVYVLAYTETELAACLQALESDRRLVADHRAGVVGTADSRAPR